MSSITISLKLFADNYKHFLRNTKTYLQTMTRKSRRKLPDTSSDSDDSFDDVDSRRDKHMDKIHEVQNAIDESREQVHIAIEKVIDRGEKLELLQEKGDDLAINAEMFHRRAVDVRRRMCWQEWKMTLMICAITLVCSLCYLFITFYLCV